jgi:hypothetical protein
MIRFIDEHKDRCSGGLRWGIEPIAKTLGIAPSTYHAAKTRPPSARAVRDAELKPLILRVWEEHLAVYGADKVWTQLECPPDHGRVGCGDHAALVASKSMGLRCSRVEWRRVGL